MAESPIVPVEALLAHEGWLRGLARTLVLDDARADDVVQETWVTALREPPRESGSIRAWLASVVRSRASDARKAESRRAAREAGVAWRDEAGPARDPVADGAAATEVHRMLTRALMELAEPYRSAVILRFFEGLPPREVGARTGVPAETARTRVNRGVAMLRERLDADHGGRRRWQALLLPIVGRGRGPSAATAGGLAMATARTYAFGALGLVLCVGAWWWLRDDGVAAAPAKRDAVVAKARTDEPERAPRARVETPDAAPAAEPAAPALPPVAPGASVRLRFVDENGAPLSPELTRARWGGGVTPSVALFDDRAIRSANRSDWLRQSVEGAGEGLRGVPLDEAAGTFGLRDRVPQGRWRLVVFPGVAPSALTRPFVVAKDGGTVDVDVVLAATPARVVRVIDLATKAPVPGARLTPWFEFGDDDAFVAGTSVTTDAAGEARLPVDDGDRARRIRPPTWWATAPGAIGSFQVRSGPSSGDAPQLVPLEPTCDVEGDAFLADGSPAAGRKVSWRRKGMTIAATCDAAGHFRLAGIPAGSPEQQLFLVEDAARGVMRGGSVRTKAGGTATMRFDPPAADAARIVVRLTSGGRPVPGMAVTCRGGEGGRTALTDADGTVVLPGIPGGAKPTVVVLLCDPRVAQDFTASSRQAPLAAGEERRLAFDVPVGAIRVRVVGADGAPVAAAHVVARPPERPDAAAAGWEVKLGDARFADDEGGTLLTGLPAGAPCEVTASDGDAGAKASATVDAGTAESPAEVTLTLR